MDSEWFFKWHGLNYGKEVDVDSFDGQRIHSGGVRFEAGTSVELVYWDAIGRYVRNKIDDVFGRAEIEVRAAPMNTSEIASDASVVLRSFCRRILLHAIDTDRRLKGRGFPDQKYVAPNSRMVTFAAEIEGRQSAICAFYKVNPAEKLTSSQRFEKFMERNKGKIQIGGVLGTTCAVLGLLGRIFGLF